jgi:peptidoglycan/xylan/chitin deacetylase (PgdA/CDA1 family)
MAGGRKGMRKYIQFALMALLLAGAALFAAGQPGIWSKGDRSGEQEQQRAAEPDNEQRQLAQSAPDAPPAELQENITDTPAPMIGPAYFPLEGPPYIAAKQQEEGPASPAEPQTPMRQAQASDGQSRDKVAYLTFDDGPSHSTPKILSILRNYGVKATFFVIGNTSEFGLAAYKQIVEEGHVLGNHTFSHNYSRIYRSPETFKEDLQRMEDLLADTVGIRPDIIRFPGGSNNQLSWKSGGRNVMKNIAREMLEDGFQYFDWNVSSTDAAAPVQEKAMIIDSVRGNSAGKEQAIVLMHDNSGKTTTVEALPTVIEQLIRDGYSFDVLKKDSFTFQFLTP